jgi:uncharacterized Zn finger protein
MILVQLGNHMSLLSNNPIIGKCSLCGGDVTINLQGNRFLFTCLRCGSVESDERQTIKMQERPQEYIGFHEKHELLK